MQFVLRLAFLIIFASVSVEANAGTVYPGVSATSRVTHNLSSWGACFDDSRLRPIRLETTNRDTAYAGYRSLVALGEGCNRALDTRGDAVFRFNWGYHPSAVPWEPGRVTTTNLRMAVFEITSFRSASPDGVVSGPAACARGEICPRPRPPSSCRFQLYAQTRHVPGLQTNGADRSASWEGSVASIAELVQTGGRGFALVSETNRINGGSWVVTEIVRRYIQDGGHRNFILTIADSEPSLQPAHRTKSVQCDGYFTARLRVDYD